jgi:hypothetical protein
MEASAGKRTHGLLVGSSKPGFRMSCVGSGGLWLGVEDIDDDDDDVDDNRSSVVVVEAVSLIVEEASVEVSIRVEEVGEGTISVVGTEALFVISLDAEDDVSEETMGEEDGDELTASGVTVGSDEINVVVLGVSAELYDVDDTSVEDEDDIGSTEEAATIDDALCWVEEGAVLREDTALQSPNPLWQVSGAQYASVLPQYEY